MDKKIFKISFWIAYAIAIILLIAFVIIVPTVWNRLQEMVSINPTIEIAPLPSVIKYWAKMFLIPSGCFAVLGYALQIVNKNKGV